MSDSVSEGLAGSWFADVRLTELAPAETWLSPKIDVRASPVHGQGTFAVAEIAAGETVEVWGQLWQGALTVEYTADAARAELAAQRDMAVMQWDDGLFSIEHRGGDPGYFINHSCDPALWFRDAFTLEARRLILAGDELTLDYALFEAHDSFRAAWTCRCGAACCRGSVTGRDWMRTDLRSRYAGRFTPLLNKRIAALPAGRRSDTVRADRSDRRAHLRAEPWSGAADAQQATLQHGDRRGEARWLRQAGSRPV